MRHVNDEKRKTTNDERNKTTKSMRTLGVKETYKCLEILEADTMKQAEIK